MTEIKTTKIPQRQKCVNKEHPYIGGAEDIFDDEQGLTQAKINEIVLSDAINVSLSASKKVVNDNLLVELIARCSVDASITIKRKTGNEEYEIVATTATDDKTLSATHAFNPTGNTLVDTYIAEFKIGDLIKTVTANAGAIFVVCGEDWTDAQGRTPDDEDTYIKTSTSGTYNVNVDRFISVVSPGPLHVYFIIPSSMSINKNNVSMGTLTFPLQDSVESTFQGANCKYYESSNDYPTGTLTIKIS